MGLLSIIRQITAKTLQILKYILDIELFPELSGRILPISYFLLTSSTTLVTALWVVVIQSLNNALYHYGIFLTVILSLITAL